MIRTNCSPVEYTRDSIPQPGMAGSHTQDLMMIKESHPASKVNIIKQQFLNISR